MVDVIVNLIRTVYNFLWGDLFVIPLPGGQELPLSLLVIILIPAGIYFTIKTRFLPIRLFPDMVHVLLEKKDGKGKIEIEYLSQNDLTRILDILNIQFDE